MRPSDCLDEDSSIVFSGLNRNETANTMVSTKCGAISLGCKQYFLTSFVLLRKKIKIFVLIKIYTQIMLSLSIEIRLRI